MHEVAFEMYQKIVGREILDAIKHLSAREFNRTLQAMTEVEQMSEMLEDARNGVLPTEDPEAINGNPSLAKAKTLHAIETYKMIKIQRIQEEAANQNQSQSGNE